MDSPHAHRSSGGCVGGPAVDAGGCQRAIKQPTRGADKRMTLEIFVVARLFPDEHQLRARGSFAEHGLRRVLPERAIAAVLRRVLQPGERLALRLFHDSLERAARRAVRAQ